MHLSVIIVSYNTREMTLKCLESLYADIGESSVEVTVIDNASTDGSLLAIQKRFPRVIAIPNRRNTGFGAANNLAFKQMNGRHALLLNSDAFMRPGTIRAMIDAIDSDLRIGVVGPRLLNADGSLQRSVFRFPSPIQAWLENLWLSRLLARVGIREDFERWPHDVMRDVPWVVGACMLARGEVIERVGGFDEQFFMYSEEADWQKRIRDAGWRIVFTPAAEVMHLGGGSGTSEPARVTGHFFDSLDRYVRKHHGWFGVLHLRLAMVIGCALRWMIWSASSLIRPDRSHALTKRRNHRWLLMRQITTKFPAIR